MLTIVSISGCAPSFCQSDNPGCISQLVGTYYGEANTGYMVPTLTSFYFNEKGNIEGKYFIGVNGYETYKTVSYEGNILEIKPVGKYMMRAFWQDVAGKGPLRIMFTLDGHDFVGYWGPSKGDRSNAWYGRKISAKPTVTMKDLDELYAKLPTRMDGWSWRED